jgi:hypothetical protein
VRDLALAILRQKAAVMPTAIVFGLNFVAFLLYAAGSITDKPAAVPSSATGTNNNGTTPGTTMTNASLSTVDYDFPHLLRAEPEVLI